jgi:hypothetical protein
VSSPEDSPLTNQLPWLGALACLGYAIHAGYLIHSGNAHDAVWVCHISALVVGVGLIFRSALLNAAGLMCLSVGLPMWLLYLASGEPLMPTSPLTHILGLAIATAGMRQLGLPKRAWLVALSLVAALMVVSRLVTPAEANVNLAFGPMSGLSLWTAGGVAHWVFLLTQWALGLAVVQFAWSLLSAPRMT